MTSLGDMHNEATTEFWASPLATELLGATMQTLAERGSGAPVQACKDEELEDMLVSHILEAQGLDQQMADQAQVDAADWAQAFLSGEAVPLCETGSDASFGMGGPNALIKKLEELGNSQDPTHSLNRLTQSYELLELEAAQPDSFRQGAQLLSCGLLHPLPAAAQAYSQAFSLVTEAVQSREDALFDMLNCVLDLGSNDAKVAGVHWFCRHGFIVSLTRHEICT